MTTVLWAPAKLTTSLRITGVRDDGLHLIDAEMVSLDLADRIELDAHEVSPGTTKLEVHTAAGGFHVDADPDNLVLRACRLAGRHPASVLLHKCIPAGGGLGGGSADAAAVLRWAGWRDVAASASLGADVAFCLIGGRCRVQGIGEVLTPLEPVSHVFTLALAPFGCSTPAVYQAWDRLGGPVGENGNDLEPAALIVEPRLAQIRDALGEATGCKPRLAGSGSTWFVDGAHPDAGLVVRTVQAGWSGPEDGAGAEQELRRSS